MAGSVTEPVIAVITATSPDSLLGINVGEDDQTDISEPAFCCYTRQHHSRKECWEWQRRPTANIERDSGDWLIAKMTSIVKKILKVHRTSKEPNSNLKSPTSTSSSGSITLTPQYPPTPELSHLTPEEIEILKEVFQRQEVFEKEETTRIRSVQEQMRGLEDGARIQSSMKNKLKHVDLRLCRLCYKTKFADGVGRVCADCHKRVCSKCGSFARPHWDSKRNKSIRGKWRCTVCTMRREMLCKTGKWFHGNGAQNVVVHRKSISERINSISSINQDTESDIVEGPQISDDNRADCYIGSGNRTDSELVLNIREPISNKHVHRTHRRRGSRKHDESRDEDDADVDQEQFHQERQMYRQKRHQMKTKRRNSVKQTIPYHNSEESPSNQRMNKQLSYESDISDHISSNNRKMANSDTPSPSTPPRRRRNMHERSVTICTPPKRKLGDSPRDNLRSLDIPVGDYVPDEGVSARIKRQDAISYSSSSTSIISDARSSDVQSTAASPVSSRRDPAKCLIHSISQPGTRPMTLLQIPSSGYGAPTTTLLSPPTPTHRRVTLSTCEKIDFNAKPDQERYIPANPHQVIIHRDKEDKSYRTGGLGMRVVGGRQMEDGTLAAYVSYVFPDGPADIQGNIAVGDRILEWDGQSMVGATFEEVREIIDRSGDILQLVIFHDPSRSQIGAPEKSQAPPEKAVLSKSGSIDSEVVVTVEPDHPETARLSAKPKRRMLPKTPIEIKREPKQISGRILLQLSYREDTYCLAVEPVRAEGLKLRTTSTKRLPRPLVMLHLLPDRTFSPGHEAPSLMDTPNPEWYRTFVFEDITSEEINSKSLEVTIWDISASTEDDFLGEVLLDLKDANLLSDPIWYDLEDHDENSSPLPLRKKSFSDASPFSSSSSLDLLGYRTPPGHSLSSLSRHATIDSQRALPPTPAHDKAKMLLNRRASPIRNEIDQCSSSHSSPLHSPGSGAELDKSTVVRDTFTKKVKRKMTNAVTRVSTGFLKDSDDDKENVTGIAFSKSANNIDDPSLCIGASGSGRLSMDLLSPPRPVSRAMSDGSFESEEDTKSTASQSALSIDRSSDRLAPDGNGITSVLGPGQVPPKSSMENLTHGNMKLGFMVSKGQLEIDVVCARGLATGPTPHPPDTYVKTYLMEGNKNVQKKKTKLIKCTFDPSYRQKLKYSACNVYGRYMKVNVWEKQRGFDKKLCLGEIVVKLDNIDLSKQSGGWYKLFQISAAEMGSSESLIHW